MAEEAFPEPDHRVFGRDLADDDEEEEESCSSVLLSPLVRLWSLCSSFPLSSVLIVAVCLLAQRFDFIETTKELALRLWQERAESGGGPERWLVGSLVLFFLIFLFTFLGGSWCCLGGKAKSDENLLGSELAGGKGSAGASRGYNATGRRRRSSFPQAETLTDVPGQPVERGAIGLQNHGLTCYVAAPLQALNGIPELTAFFLSGRWQREVSASAGSDLAQAFALQLCAMWRGDIKAQAPRAFIKSLARCFPVLYGPQDNDSSSSSSSTALIAGGAVAGTGAAVDRLPVPQQHDNAELLMMMLDRLHNELASAPSSASSSAGESSGSASPLLSPSSSPSAPLSISAAAKRAWEQHLYSASHRGRSVISDFFESQQVTITRCLATTTKTKSGGSSSSSSCCGYEATNFEPSLFMCLAIPPTPHVLKVKVVASVALQSIAKGISEIFFDGEGDNADDNKKRHDVKAVDFDRMPLISEHTVAMPQRVPATTATDEATTTSTKMKMVPPTVAHLKAALLRSYTRLFVDVGAFDMSLLLPGEHQQRQLHQLLPFDLTLIETHNGLMKYPLKDTTLLSDLYRKPKGTELVAYLLPSLRHKDIGWRMVPVIHRERLWLRKTTKAAEEAGSAGTATATATTAAAEGRGEDCEPPSDLCTYDEQRIVVPSPAPVPFVLRLQTGDSLEEVMGAVELLISECWDDFTGVRGGAGDGGKGGKGSLKLKKPPSVVWAEDSTGGLSCGLCDPATTACSGCLLPAILPTKRLRECHEHLQRLHHDVGTATREAIIDSCFYNPEHPAWSQELAPEKEDFPRCIAIDWWDLALSAVSGKKETVVYDGQDEANHVLGLEARKELYRRLMTAARTAASRGAGHADAEAECDPSSSVFPPALRPDYLSGFPFSPAVVVAPEPTLRLPLAGEDEDCSEQKEGEREEETDSIVGSDEKPQSLLSLAAVPHDTDVPVSLHRCLSLQYGRKTYLEGSEAYACPRCERKVEKASQESFIVRPPKVLTILLKRFVVVNNYGDTEKSFVPVTFPINGLSLKSYLLPSSTNASSASSAGPTQPKSGKFKGKGRDGKKAEASEGEEGRGDAEDDAVYDLFAVVNHYGGLTGGHYTASVKHPLSSTWHTFDDANVKTLASSAASAAAGGAGEDAAAAEEAEEEDDEKAAFQRAVEALERKLAAEGSNAVSTVGASGGGQGGKAREKREKRKKKKRGAAAESASAADGGQEVGVGVGVGIEDGDVDESLMLEQALVTPAAYLLFYRRRCLSSSS